VALLGLLQPTKGTAKRASYYLSFAINAVAAMVRVALCGAVGVQAGVCFLRELVPSCSSRASRCDALWRYCTFSKLHSSIPVVYVACMLSELSREADRMLRPHMWLTVCMTWLSCRPPALQTFMAKPTRRAALRCTFRRLH
jgi:hypothetical protein